MKKELEIETHKFTTESTLMVHVYFGELPKNEVFLHKGDFFKKANVSSEYVKNLTTKENEIFEMHYGCLISKKRFDELKLKPETIRTV